MTSTNDHPSFDIYPYPFTNRAFCFGCAEGRHGRIIQRQRRFTSPYANNPTFYSEIICEGCDMVMRLFRLYIPEVIQTYSDKGWVVWLMESRIYLAWKHLFDAIELEKIELGVFNSYHTLEQDPQVVSLEFTDAGEEPEELMRVLLKIGATLPKPATIETKYYEHPLEVDFGSVDWSGENR